MLACPRTFAVDTFLRSSHPFLLALALGALVACSGKSANPPEASPAPASPVQAAPAPAPAAPAAPAPAASNDAELRAFAHSVEGTYGWQSPGKLSYDFFTDGRLHIQGSEGESTMWEGTWTLAHGKAKLVSDAPGHPKEVTISRAGDTLVIDGVPYTRYRVE